MFSETVLSKVESLAMQVAEREGCRIYDLEFSSGYGGRILRVFIDKNDGATVEDCANVSRGLNLLLDVEDAISGGAYHLEVSTPGLERTLKKTWHFSEAKGKKVWVKLSENLQSFGLQSKNLGLAKQLTEVLSDVEESGVRFQIENENIFIPFHAIEKAHVVYEFVNKQNLKPGQKKAAGKKDKK